MVNFFSRFHGFDCIIKNKILLEDLIIGIFSLKNVEDAKLPLNEINTKIYFVRNSFEFNIGVLVVNIQPIFSNVKEIAAGSEEASSATEEQAVTSEEIPASAQELVDLSISLSSLMSQYKTSMRN